MDINHGASLCTSTRKILGQILQDKFSFKLNLFPFSSVPHFFLPLKYGFSFYVFLQISNKKSY